jgi:hypothetical protein
MTPRQEKILQAVVEQYAEVKFLMFQVQPSGQIWQNLNVMAL